MNFSKYLLGVAFSLLLVGCGGGGGNASAPAVAASAPAPTAEATANKSVAAIKINSSGSTLKADGTSLVTFTVFALTSGNASVEGATIDFSATNGVILSKPSVVTSASGATLTMLAAASDQSNRSVTLTASCNACSASPATSEVKVVGATVALPSLGALPVVVGGSKVTLSATVKDVAGLAIQGASVSFASTDSSVLGLGALTGVTNSKGIATVDVSGLASGTASVIVTALGDAASQVFTSGTPASVFAVTSPADKTIIVTNASQTITVSAPDPKMSPITFATTLGTFENGGSSQSVPVVGGSASVVLKSTQGGTATVTVIDNQAHSASLSLVVSPPVSAVNKILLKASQTTLPISQESGVVSSVTMTARAVAFDGTTDQSVANAPIEFSMSGGPGGGEFLSPALAYTDSAGYAVATFTAGTASSIPNGVVIAARLQGSGIQTGTSPSNNSAQLTIGGQALSVAFGPATKIESSSDNTLYTMAYSVQVTDANNNPVANQPVTLRMRPVAFNLGRGCVVTKTYCSEDVNANDSLESSIEDGVRTELPLNDAVAAGTCPAAAPTATGTKDKILTPQNSDAGAVPSSVVTNANGTASFSHTYLKSQSLWIINKLTATVSSNGTETSKSIIFQPRAQKDDVDPDCYISDSPYSF